MSPTRFFHSLLFVAAIAAGASCADPSPLGVVPLQSDAQAVRAKPVPTSHNLAQCRPLEADTATEEIGPEGGEIDVGSHTLSIPPLALSETVRITAVAPSDTVREVRFQPEGLVFQRPAVLRLNYANCKTMSGAALRIAQVSDSQTILEYLPTISTKSRSVIGSLPHFSNYAVAY